MRASTVEEFEEALVGCGAHRGAEREAGHRHPGRARGCHDRRPSARTRGELILHPQSGDLSFEIMEADPRRIKRLRVRRQPVSDDKADDDKADDD